MKMLLLPLMLMNTPGDLPGPHCNTEIIEADHPQTSLRSSQIYRYPEFINGTVYFANGTKRPAKLNYNYQHGQVQFIGPLADTLLVTGKAYIDRVEMEGKVFFLSDAHGDMEAIERFGNVYLGERMQPEAIGTKLSHSGQRFSASNGSTSSSLLVSNQGGHFQWENNATGQSWSVRASYFLIDRNRVYRTATRRNFLTVYGRHKREVNRFLRDNKVNFKNAADLRKLLIFCEGLASF
nr:hypothetical protein [uncultured Dyadobacter sp.]